MPEEKKQKKYITGLKEFKVDGKYNGMLQIEKKLNSELDYLDDDNLKLRMCISCENDFYGGPGRLLCKACKDSLTPIPIEEQNLPEAKTLEDVINIYRSRYQGIIKIINNDKTEYYVDSVGMAEEYFKGVKND